MSKRVVFIVLGIILLVGGGAVAVTAGFVIALFGSDSAVTSGRHSVSTPTYALVTDPARISDTRDVVTILGQPRLRISAAQDDGIFVGVGPTAAVDRYLTGVAVDEVSDFDLDPFRLQTQRRDGTAVPASPSGQEFWTTTNSGSARTLDWKMSDGSYRIVVMNVDAAPGVELEGRFGLEIPHLFPIGLTALIIGVVAVAGGVTLLVAARSRRPRPVVDAAGPDDQRLPANHAWPS